MRHQLTFNCPPPPDTVNKGFTLAGGIMPRSIFTKTCKRGFTLAEVLITLGVIGIVAALTLPSLVQKNTEKQTVARLKKSAAVMNQAYNMAKAEKGSIENAGLNDFIYDELGNASVSKEGSTNMAKYFESYLKVIDKCEEKDCRNREYKLLGGSPYIIENSKSKSYILNDGSLVVFTSWSAQCKNTVGKLSNLCGSLTIDINGKKKPNQLGVDAFAFYVSKDSIIPWGTTFDNTGGNSFNLKCVHGGNNPENGYACTAWVLYKENMDYLHCGGLNWDNKFKCN